MHTPPLLLRKKEVATVLLYLIVDALALIFGVLVVVLTVIPTVKHYNHEIKISADFINTIIARAAIQAIGVGKFPNIIYVPVHYLNY